MISVLQLLNFHSAMSNYDRDDVLSCIARTATNMDEVLSCIARTATKRDDVLSCIAKTSSV